MYMLGKVFFKLFLNWASNIRLIFHNLLIYRIYLQSNLLRKNSLTTQDQATSALAFNEEIRTRYKHLVTILNSVEEMRQ
jgi:hypothetical protein